MLDGRPVIIAFGDSLTAGYGADPGDSYPDYLQKDLDAKGYHYQVVNQGISGNTSKDGVDRLEEALRLKPVLVIVAFGGNDGLRGLPIASTRENLDRMVSTLLNSGAKVVLGGITLPPNYGPDYIRQFNQTYTLLAAKYHVPCCRSCSKTFMGWRRNAGRRHSRERPRQRAGGQESAPSDRAPAQEVTPSTQNHNGLEERAGHTAHNRNQVTLTGENLGQGSGGKLRKIHGIAVS